MYNVSKAKNIFSKFLESKVGRALDSAKEARNFSLRKGRNDFYDKHIKQYVDPTMEEWLEEIFGCCYNSDHSEGQQSSCSSINKKHQSFYTNYDEFFTALDQEQFDTGNLDSEIA